MNYEEISGGNYRYRLKDDYFHALDFRVGEAERGLRRDDIVGRTGDALDPPARARRRLLLCDTTYSINPTAY